MEFKKLFISRCSTIQKNRDTALLALSLHHHSFGELTMIRYYCNDSNTEIDTIVSIGIKTGIGKDCFKVITLSGGNLINKVVYEAPDISSLVHGEIYIYIDETHKPFYAYEVGGERVLEEISGGPYRYTVVDDGYIWFFLDGIVKREDDFYPRWKIDEIVGDINSNLLEEIRKIKEQLKEHQDWLIEIDKEVFPMDFKLTNKSGTLFLTGTTQNILLEAAVTRKGKNIANECTFKLNNSDIALDNKNQYLVEGLTQTTTLTMESYYKKLDLRQSKSSVVNFGYNYYYGLIPKEGWVPEESNIKKLNKKLSTKSNQSLRFDLDLEHRIVFCCPKIYGKLTSIKDQSNLDYIKDYSVQESTVEGVVYYVYTKQVLANYKGFLQNFNY